MELDKSKTSFSFFRTISFPLKNKVELLRIKWWKMSKRVFYIPKSKSVDGKMKPLLLEIASKWFGAATFSEVEWNVKNLNVVDYRS